MLLTSGTIKAYTSGLYSGVVGEVKATNNSIIDNLMLSEARKNRWVFVRGFLASGADIFSRDRADGAIAPIIFASHNNYEVVSELVDSNPEFLKIRDVFGNSIATWAAYYNNVELLIKLVRIDDSVLLHEDEGVMLPVEHLMHHKNIRAVKELVKVSQIVLGQDSVIKIAIRRYRDPSMVAELLVAGFREPSNFDEFMAAHRVNKQEVYDIVMSMSE